MYIHSPPFFLTRGVAGGPSWQLAGRGATVESADVLWRQQL